MKRKPFHWQRFSLLLLFLCLACFKPTVDQSKFFVLTSDSPAQETLQEKQLASRNQSKEFSLLLGPITIPTYLDRPQIVTRQSTNQLAYSESNRWAESLQFSISRVLKKNFEDQLDFSQINLFGHYGRWNDKYQLEMDILQFDCDIHGQIILKAAWKFRQRRILRKLLAKNETTVTVQATDLSTESKVAGLSQALGQLSKEIAAQIKEIIS